MIAAPEVSKVSLIEWVSAVTGLRSACDERGAEADERRASCRFEPAERVTVRLDVQGGIWSAGVVDLSERAARLAVDDLLASRVADEEPASISLEMMDGSRADLSGRLRLHGELAPRLTFTHDSYMNRAG